MTRAWCDVQSGQFHLENWLVKIRFWISGTEEEDGKCYQTWQGKITLALKFERETWLENGLYSNEFNEGELRELLVNSGFDYQDVQDGLDWCWKQHVNNHLCDTAWELEHCAYCNVLVRPDDILRAPDDDAAWEAEEQQHLNGCAWVQTRGFRRVG